MSSFHGYRGEPLGSLFLSISNVFGTGEMRKLVLCDGVTLLFNSFQTAWYPTGYQSREELFCIDYCRLGRLEHRIGKNCTSIFSSGDLRIDGRKKLYCDFHMPHCRYEGLSIALHPERADAALSALFPGCVPSVSHLYCMLCSSPSPFFLRQDPIIGGLFGAMYKVPSRDPKAYMMIKLLELLHYLDLIAPHAASDESYLSPEQLKTIQAVRAYIDGHFDEPCTIQRLSTMFGLSPSRLKRNFKRVCGLSVHRYVRSVRLEQAAVLLQKSQSSSACIACELGYSNPSKFAAAFKERYGCSPREYRIYTRL